jgi:hypothetical protein
MRKTLLYLTIIFLVTLVSAPLLAFQEHIIYPAQGQSAEQMDRDRFECYTWARDQTGFDPMALQMATAPPPRQQAEGSVAGGAVGGGLLGAGAGAAIGAIAGDAGRGAAIGAISGGLLGGTRRSNQASGDRRRQAQWEREQVDNIQRNRAAYNRAFRACLEGRGYTVH